MVYIDNDPVKLFRLWFEMAKEKCLNNPEAMVLSTVAEDGSPDSRVVLMKSFTDAGEFRFFTNGKSVKAKNINAMSKVSLLFYWREISRQVRVSGMAEELARAEVEEYFATRPRSSQIAAWASKQSDELQDIADLSNAVEKYSEQYDKKPVPTPPQWTGFCVAAMKIEFWEEKPFRLHSRTVFDRASVGGDWRGKYLYP